MSTIRYSSLDTLNKGDVAILVKGATSPLVQKMQKMPLITDETKINNVGTVDTIWRDGSNFYLTGTIIEMARRFPYVQKLTDGKLIFNSKFSQTTNYNYIPFIIALGQQIYGLYGVFPTVVADGAIQLYQLDAVSGKTIKTETILNVLSTVTPTLAIDSSSYYLAGAFTKTLVLDNNELQSTMQTGFVARRVFNGKWLWSITLGQGVSQVTSNSKMCYALSISSNKNTTLSAINIANGKIEWSQEFSSSKSLKPQGLVADNKNVYALITYSSDLSSGDVKIQDGNMALFKLDLNGEIVKYITGNLGDTSNLPQTLNLALSNGLLIYGWANKPVFDNLSLNSSTAFLLWTSTTLEWRDLQSLTSDKSSIAHNALTSSSTTFNIYNGLLLEGQYLIPRTVGLSTANVSNQYNVDFYGVTKNAPNGGSAGQDYYLSDQGLTTTKTDRYYGTLLTSTDFLIK